MNNEIKHICKFCGAPAIYKFKTSNDWCCKPYATQCPENKRKNSEGMKRAVNEKEKITGYHCIRNTRYENFPEDVKERMKWAKGKTKETCESLKRQGQTFSKHYKEGKFKDSQQDRPHTEEEIENIRKGMLKCFGKHKGNYKGIHYDSGWELAYIIYNLEHGIPFSRCNRSLKYIHPKDGKEHTYFPDFEEPGNVIVEIKGYMSTEALAKISSITESYNLKSKIIDKQKMQPYLDYVISKYGKDFVEKFKNNVGI